MSKFKAIIVLLIACASLFAHQASAYEIVWRFTDRMSLSVDPLREGSFDNVGFDLLGYARGHAALRGGAWHSVTVYLASNNAYGWRMKYYVPSQNKWRHEGFDMLAVAQWQGQQQYGNRMKNWGVYFRNFQSPNSWRGIYINRI